MINEENRLIIGLFRCMYSQGSLISVNKAIYSPFLSIIYQNFKLREIFFNAWQRDFLCDNHAKCMTHAWQV